MKFRPLQPALTVLLLFAVHVGGDAEPPAVGALPNGLRLIVRERYSSPLVAIDLWVRAGAREEAPDEYGAAHFLEHTLFKGTRTRLPGEVDEAIESLGGTLDAATGPDYAHFYTTVPSGKLEPALAIVADVVMNAMLPDAEVARERGVILDELAQHAARPDERLIDLLFENGFQQGPYHRSPGGTPAAIGARGRDTLAAFYRRCYTPDRSTLVLVGDVAPEIARQDAARAFSGWRSSGREPSAEQADPAEVRFSAMPQQITLHADTVSPWIGLAFPAPPSQDWPLSAAGRVVASLLGEAGKRGRLNTTALSGSEAVVRYVPRRNATLFLVTGQVTGQVRNRTSGGRAGTADIAGLEVALTNAIASIVTAPPGVDELAEAKRDVAGHLQYDQETDAGLAHALGYADLTGGEAPEAERARIAQITAQDVQRFANRFLAASRQLTIRLLPGEEITRGVP